VILNRRTFVALLATVLSRVRALAQPRVAAPWVWMGGCMAEGITVKAGSSPGMTLRLVVSERDSSGSAPAADLTAATDPSGVATFALTGLRPATRYSFTVSAPGGTPETGTFKTFANGPMSFRIVFASCASTGSTSPVFEAVRELQPDLYLHTGDLHYADITRNDPAAFAAAYRRVLTASTQSVLHRFVPIGYVWDDHDYGSNNADRTWASRPAALAAYRVFVPHYPLAADPDGTIHQVFTIGRVRVLLTDTRSARSPRSGPAADRTMLGREQLEWLLAQLEAAADIPLVIWVNTVPWITKRDEGSKDGWAPYSAERRRIADKIVALDLTSRLLMLSGDAHMLAIDDGRNSQYAGGAAAGTRGFIVAHAAPLDRPTSRKGGPYSHGEIRQNGQFGVVDVVDDGGEVLKVTVQGHRGRVPVPNMRIAFECRTRTLR
jgi:phosphodiesterase/alkaline phosphatase D-like protein